MKKHKKLPYKEPTNDSLSNRDKFEMALLLIVCVFGAAMIVAFIISSVQAVSNVK